MNILLFAPGLLVLLLARFGLVDTIPRLALCAAIQVRALPTLKMDFPIVSALACAILRKLAQC